MALEHHWVKLDIPWLRNTIEYIKNDGYPKVAKLLEAEVDKIESEK